MTETLDFPRRPKDRRRATRASRSRAARREIVLAASHQRRSGLLGHVVSGDARHEARADGPGPPGRRHRPKNLSQFPENIDSAPGIPSAPRSHPCGQVRLVGRLVSGDAHDEAREDSRGPPGRRPRPENLSQFLENIDSAPGIATLPRGYPGGWVSLVRQAASGDAHDEAREDGREAPGRCPRPENLSQSFENIDSAPGIPSAPRSHPRGRVRLVGRLVSGDAHDEAREDSRGPLWRRHRPKNLSQSLENIDSAPRIPTPPRDYRGGRIRLVRYVGAGGAHDEVREDGCEAPGLCDRPENLSQSLENIDSAPGIATLPRGYRSGRVRLVRHVGAGDAHDEAREDGRGPPGRCGRPENL